MVIPWDRKGSRVGNGLLSQVEQEMTSIRRVEQGNGHLLHRVDSKGAETP